MYRKKMLQGLVALGILAAVNAPAHAMQEEIFSYGGYDIFRVQYFDAADQAGLEAVGNNLWNDNGDACRGLTYSYSTLQLLCCITLIPAHSCQELHDDIGIFGSLGTISQTAKKYFLVYQLI